MEAVGLSGGIWIFWNDDTPVEVLKIHPQFVHMQVGVGGDKNWLNISVAYGSPNPTLTKFLWQDFQ